MRLHFIITMAGFGSRFREAGYRCPKYQIVVKSRTVFTWAMLSLRSWFSNATFVFVMRRDDDAETFVADQCRSLGIERAHHVLLDSPTDGQATTALLALDSCNDDDAIAIYNIDTHITPGAFQIPDAFDDVAGFLPSFRAAGSHWSFVALDGDGRVRDVAEKRRISGFATVGLYWFATAGLYRASYRAIYAGQEWRSSCPEAYIAPMYRHLLQAGLIVRSTILEPDSVHALGTPAELEEFAQAEYDLL